MPTDSNESLTSSSVVVPSMNISTTNTTTTITTSINQNNGSSLSNHSRPNSPLQSSIKQLNKLKRFLSTLYHFGSDISNEIGERVRALILALVVSFVLFFFDTGFQIA
jgi:predicted PurR-regulated permease PerM